MRTTQRRAVRSEENPIDVSVSTVTFCLSATTTPASWNSPNQIICGDRGAREQGHPGNGVVGRFGGMPTEVVDVLKAARKRQIEDRLAAGAQYGGGEHVASNQLGEPQHPDAITSRWEKQLKNLSDPGCAATRRQTFVRDVDASARGAYRGDRGVARARVGGVHNSDLRAQPGRRVEAAASSFGRVVTTRDTETGAT